MSSSFGMRYTKLCVSMLALLHISLDSIQAQICQATTEQSKTSSNCLPNCGSSSVSGSFVPPGTLRWSNASESGEVVWKQSDYAPSTFVMDLLSDGKLSQDYSTASVRCTRDEDMSLTCRIGKDLCENDTTYDKYKGVQNWSLTDVGARRFTHCEYAYSWEYYYASRDCLVGTTFNGTVAVWNHTDIHNCPLPPMSRSLTSLVNNITSGVISLQDDQSCETVLSSMNNLMLIRRSRPTDPVFQSDHQNLQETCLRWASGCLGDNSPQLRQSMSILWNVSDILFDPAFVQMWIPTEAYTSFVRYVAWLLPEPVISDPFVYQGFNLYGYATNVFTPTNLTLSFSGETDISAVVSISANIDVAIKDFGAYLVNGPLLISTRIVQPIKCCNTPSSDPYANPVPPSESAGHIPAVAGDAALRGNLSPINKNPFSETTTKELSAINPSLTTGIASLSGSKAIPMLSTSSYQYENGYQYQNGTVNGKVGQNPGSSWRVIGPLIFVRFVVDINLDNAVNKSKTQMKSIFPRILFTIQHPAYREIDANNVLVTSSTEDGIMKGQWYSNECNLTGFKYDTVNFSCSGPGYAVISIPELHSLGADAPPGTPEMIPPPKTENDLSVFLGFPYNNELYITGQVLRAISLFCLVITVLSFSVFRLTRRGVPTRILLNLCVSLIVLNIVLYVAEAKAGSKVGCRVSNVFRYYLVFVSLLWNGVEAHNMYRMLVKVFNADVSHFVLKSAIIAWGLPAVAVGISLAVNISAFDGSYFNCQFRCSLLHNTLYYGWVIPMGVIIIHNVIIFILVMTILCRKKPTESTSSSSQSGSTNWTRLCGAFTMLALLGVPWLFSAFGVIDSGENVTLKVIEGIFNGIFIVCTSLQGMFIFGFHCARLKVVRDSWKNVLVPTFVKTSFSSTRSTLRTSLENLTSPRTSVGSMGNLKSPRTSVGSMGNLKSPRTSVGSQGNLKSPRISLESLGNPTSPCTFVESLGNLTPPRTSVGSVFGEVDQPANLHDLYKRIKQESCNLKHDNKTTIT